MKYSIGGFIVFAAMLAGCGGDDATTGTEEEQGTETQAALPEPDYEIPMRNFAPAQAGPYALQPMFEEEIENGHYNIKVTGPEFKAVRFWIGTDNRSNSMVVKAVLENDYQHGHLELPKELPADYALWIEVEAPDGETHVASTPLKQAQ
jgi:hypothetical protein